MREGNILIYSGVKKYNIAGAEIASLLRKEWKDKILKK